VIRRLSASFVFVLVFLTLVGHACELPLELALAHAHEDAHNASDHHADDSEIACDAVLGLRPPTQALSGLDLDVHVPPHPVLKILALRAVATVPLHPAPPGHGRPPLFLLHAALLI
jgi:hypothetical protein